MFQPLRSYDCEMSKSKLWSNLSDEMVSYMNMIIGGICSHLCQGALLNVTSKVTWLA